MHAVNEAALVNDTDCEVVGNEHTSAMVFLLHDKADPLQWVEDNAETLRGHLAERGFLVLRGLPVQIAAFDRVVRLVGGEPLEYTERSTPRSAVEGNIYTSTDYPADQPIPMHSENSYSDSWPRTLFFFCDTAPEAGGATPIANSASVLKLISPAVRERFADGVIYTRSYRDGLGLGWREGFQTEDPADVERYCAAHGIEFEWVDEDTLRTRHHRPSTRVDGRTGNEVWFNQATLFHESSVDPQVRAALREVCETEADLPRNAYHGDGSPISDHDLAVVTKAFHTASLVLPWRPGDLFVVNNSLMAHGRQPFTGSRRILVAMT
jgi:alpha-ketoglutarate-dependent taurine dioxygenase